MSSFSDRILLHFLQNTFIEDLLQNQLGLAVLFNLTYATPDLELQEIDLADVQIRQFQMPVFESIRTTGTEERILPTPERIQIQHTQERYGRLAWVDVLLDLVLATKVHHQGASLERITTTSLLAELGEVASFAELRDQLEERYTTSIVDAWFERLRIRNLEDFRQKAPLLVDLASSTPPPFDPNDPSNSRNFKLHICIKLQPELNIVESLQAAKLCRSILEQERDFYQPIEGGEIQQSYVFVTLFPESGAADNVIPGLSATQIQTSVKTLFKAEDMLAHFVSGV